MYFCDIIVAGKHSMDILFVRKCARIVVLVEKVVSRTASGLYNLVCCFKDSQQCRCGTAIMCSLMNVVSWSVLLVAIYFQLPCYMLFKFSSLAPLGY